MADKSKDRGRPPGCTCGTGNYCSLHEVYSVEPEVRLARVRLKKAPREGWRYQKCGGGKRILRKKKGGDNY